MRSRIQVNVRRLDQALQLCLMSAVSLIVCQENTPISSIPAYSKLKTASSAFCQAEISFPGQQAELLDTKEKMEKYKAEVEPEVAALFEKVAQNTEVFNISKYTPTDMIISLSAMMQIFQSNTGVQGLDSWLTSSLTLKADLAVLKKLITIFPTLILMFQQVKIDHVMSSLTEEELSVVCEAILSPATPATDTAVILRYYPHCVILFSRRAQQDSQNLAHVTPPQTIPLIGAPKSMLVYDRLRDIRDLWLTDFLIDPSQLTKSDVDNIPEELFQVISSHKILNRILLYLKPEIHKQLAHSILKANGKPTEWNDSLMNLVGNYLVFLPQSELEQYISDDVLERLLDRNDTMMNKNMAWLMVPTLFEKRNSTNFIKRFSFALFYHTSATIAMLDGFEQADLFDVLKRSAALFNDLLPAPSFFYCSLTEAVLYAWKNFQTENIISHLTSHDQNLKLVQIQPLLEKLFLDETATVSAPNLVEISMFLPAAPNHVFENISASDLYQAWPTLGKTGIIYTFAKLQLIYEKIKIFYPDSESMKPEHVISLGPLLLVLPCDSLKAIPNLTLTTVVMEGYFSQEMPMRCDENPEVCWIIASKAVHGASDDLKSVIVTELGPLGRFIKLDDLDDRIYYNLYFTASVTKEMHHRATYQTFETANKYSVPKKQSTSVVSVKGYTTESVEVKYQQSMTNEFMITHLPVSAIGLDLLMSVHQVLRIMAKTTVQKIETALLETCYGLLRKFYGIRSGMSDVCVAKVVADSLVCFFTRASKADLSRLSLDSQKMILWAEGRSEDCVSLMPPKQIRAHFQLLLSIDTELATAEVWTPEMVVIHGPALLCGMSSGHIGRLSPRAASQIGHHLCQCFQLSTKTRKALFDKILQNYHGNINEFFSSPLSVGSVGSCLMFASHTQLLSLNTTNKKSLASMTIVVMNAMWYRLVSLKADNSRKADTWTEEALVKALIQNIQLIMDELGMPRLKQISQFGKFQHFLLVDLISNLTNTEFVEALQTFRENYLWNAEQIQVLRTKMLEVKKLSSIISPEHVEADGDMCMLNTAIPSLINNEGHFGNMCTRASNETVTELASKYPQLLCCLSIQQVQSLEPEIVVKLIQNIENECYPCLIQRKELLVKMAAKFQEYMGNQNLSDKLMLGSLFKDMKCVAGMLPESYLLAQPVGIVLDLGLDALRLLLPETFCQLATPAMLPAFTMEQRYAINFDKISCLTAQQLLVLQETFESPDITEADDSTEFLPDLSTTQIGNIPGFTTMMTALSSYFIQREINTGCQCIPPQGILIYHLANYSLWGVHQVLDTKMNSTLDKILSRNDTDLSSFTMMDLELMLKYLLPNSSQGLDRVLDFIQDLTYLLQLNTKQSLVSVNNLLAQTNPRFYTLFKSQALCEAFKKLKKDQLTVLCKRLSKLDVSTQTFIVISSRCPVCIMFMDVQRKTEFHVTLDKNKGIAFYAMLLYSKKKLDLEHLLLAPQALAPDVITAVKEQQFRHIAEISLISDQHFYSQAPETILRPIFVRLMKVLGSPSTWSDLLMSRLQNYLFKMNRKMFREMFHPGMLVEILTSQDGKIDAFVGDHSLQRFVGQTLNSNILDWRLDIPKDILQIPQVFCLQLSSGLPKLLLRPQMSGYDLDFLLEMAETCPLFYQVHSYSSKKYIHRIVTDSSNDSVTLPSLRKLVGHLTGRDIRKFPGTAWIKMLPYLSENTLNYQQAVNLSCTQIMTLGKLCKVWSASYISQIPASVIAGCFSSFAAVFTEEELRYLPKPFARGLWEKMKSYLADGLNSVEGLLISNLFQAKMANIIPRGELLAMKFDLTNATVQNKIDQISVHTKGLLVAELVIHRLNMSSFDDQEFLMKNKKVADIVMRYSPGKDVDKLQHGEAMGVMLEHLADAASERSVRSLEAGFDLLKRRVGLTDMCRNETICLEQILARTLGSLFHVARVSDLKCLTKKSLRVILEVIGSQPALCEKLPRVVIRDMLSMFQDTANAKDFHDSIIDCGCLICGLTLPQVQQMTDDEVDRLHPLLSRCPQLDSNLATLIVNKMLGHYGGFQDYIRQNSDLSLGTLLRHISPQDISRLPKKEKEIIIANLGNLARLISREARDHLMRRRRGEISVEESKLTINKMNSVLSAMYKAASEVYDIGKQLEDVRTSEETCTMLEEFDGNLCFLTIEMISQLGELTVRMCAAEFQGCDYDEDILTILAAKAKNAMGTAVDQWQITDYAELGKLIGYMGEETIRQMTLSDDVMAVLPLNTLIPSGDTLMKHYLNQNGLQLSELTSQQIASYALLLGQLSLKDLNQLQPLVVGDAALLYELGSLSLEKLPFQKVQMFTNKIIESAKINFLEASTSDIEYLGSLAGALPLNILMRLTNDQKRGLTPSAIALIPGQILAKTFTVENIRSLTSEQANAVTSQQKTQLNVQQKRALASRTTVSNDDIHDSGSGLYPSCFLHFVLTLVASSAYFNNSACFCSC